MWFKHEYCKVVQNYLEIRLSEYLEIVLYGNSGVPQDQSWGPTINVKNNEAKSIDIT